MNRDKASYDREGIRAGLTLGLSQLDEEEDEMNGQCEGCGESLISGACGDWCYS